MTGGVIASKDESVGRTSGRAAPALVDAHVHYHGCYEPAAFFDHARANFRRAAAGCGLPPGWIGCLLFTECAGDNYLDQLKETRSIGDPRWSFAATGEESLVATCDGTEILLVGGRQVVTAEGLEVLALGAPDAFADGRPIEETIAAIAGAGALPVLPWGFGKWTGRRGAIAARLAQDVTHVPQLFFGDSAGRPSLWPRPRLLALAERCGRLVLPGTDPLPLAADIGKVGRLGFVVDDGLDRERPFKALARWLSARRTSPVAYGRFERPMTFVQRQVSMQLRRRRS
jgi:hypothetical protein